MTGLAACAGHPDLNTRSPGTAAATAADTGPGGTAGAGCKVARDSGSASSTPDPGDLRFGELAYQGAVENYERPRSEIQGGVPGPDEHGTSFFKTIADLPPGAEVTVSIGKTARSYAGIVTEHGKSPGYSTVTYTACPESKGKNTSWWVGGFALTGKTSACVPLEVKVNGEHKVRTATLGLGTADCGGHDQNG